MEIVFALLAALLPVILLLVFIYWKDMIIPEPKKWLLLAFLGGCFAAGAAIAIGWIMPSIEVNGFFSAFGFAFINAAIPEETLKLLFLLLLIKINPYFDEQFDGIVYASCVGLGFAAVENIEYFFVNFDCWMSLALGRALFAVPGHFFYAVIMGYYLSLYHFGVDRSVKNLIKIWTAPVIAHGIYDGILFAARPASPWVCAILSIVFVWFFYRLYKRAKKKISLLEDK